MTELENRIISRAGELLSSGEVKRVVGWKRGDFAPDVSPAVFESEEALSEFVYNGFCGANLSKYMIEISRLDGKSAVFLKSCDTYSFNQLLKEHRIDRENVYIIGVECHGMLDCRKLTKLGADGITDEKYDGRNVVFDTLRGNKTADKADVLLERCLCCKGREFMIADETIASEYNNSEETEINPDRFSEVARIEAMSADERFAYWRAQLSKCIRCNACRNVCPACSCIKCVFDNNDSAIAAKANDDEFEENLFHIVRAFHVAGRCTDCGECSRVCPQSIPLHLLNRKFIKDINEFYGEYQAGVEAEGKTPLTSYSENDREVNG